jgi:hypothetical protein
MSLVVVENKFWPESIIEDKYRNLEISGFMNK